MAKMVKADIADVRSVVEEERAHLLDDSIRQVRIPIATEHSSEYPHVEAFKECVEDHLDSVTMDDEADQHVIKVSGIHEKAGSRCYFRTKNTGDWRSGGIPPNVLAASSVNFQSIVKGLTLRRITKTDTNHYCVEEKVKKTGKGLKTKPGVRLGNGNFRNKRRKEENGWEEDGPDEIRERGKTWVEFQISATNFLGNPHYHLALLVDQNKPAKRDWKWAPAKEDSADRATKWKQELKTSWSTIHIGDFPQVLQGSAPKSHCNELQRLVD
ncbi:hypothetical protein GE061_015864 [Apolygus lucorum]|uniref:Uncharacterized protein n=1 Tax=Apolygus lucorum TaxID=248454 RepID=A0A8S9XPE8_APOLU|nr:hypothetical protein GE061_015864 [Apolygus lucorum]